MDSENNVKNLPSNGIKQESIENEENPAQGGEPMLQTRPLFKKLFEYSNEKKTSIVSGSKTSEDECQSGAAEDNFQLAVCKSEPVDFEGENSNGSQGDTLLNNIECIKNELPEEFDEIEVKQEPGDLSEDDYQNIQHVNSLDSSLERVSPVGQRSSKSPRQKKGRTKTRSKEKEWSVELDIPQEIKIGVPDRRHTVQRISEEEASRQYYDDKMASRGRLEGARITRLLRESSDEEFEGSDSEIEENLCEDEVHSDVEDYEVSLPLVESPSSTKNVSQIVSASLERTSSSMPNHIVMPQQQTLIGENDHRWTATKGSTSGRTSASNIIRSSAGPARMNRSLYDTSECFSIFITDDIVEEITKWTNAEIQLKIQRPDVKATFKATTCHEIRALIGILTLTAAMKDNHLSTNELFDCSYSGNRYIAAMSRDRFDFLIRCLRMDDKTMRPELRATDTFVPIRKIWEIFTGHCRSNYVPGACVTIDEQFLGFRGRCPFRLYTPNKPNKYGIKIVMACDSATQYMIDAMPYLGKCAQPNGLPLGEFYVKELTTAIHGSHRNVTCDNRFTSVPLAKSLLSQPYNLTLVGAMRSNEREIPEELKNTHPRRVGTSMFCYDGPLTLVSYKPKPSKLVFVLSSRDEDGTVHRTTSKPNMINFFNETKGGVDAFGQMCSSMSCSRKTNRWPVAMFYTMLNMAFINAYIIYCYNVISKREKPLGRRNFMKKLSNSLMTPWMLTRQQMLTLPTNLEEKISDILPKRLAELPAQVEGAPEPKKRKYCAFCPSKIRRMTKSMCDKCKNPICGEHRSSACPKCL